MKDVDGTRTDSRRARHEQGVALLITIFIIVLLSFMVLTSIGHSGDEAVAGARARSTARALHAADAGIQVAMSRVAKEPPDTDPINFPLGAMTVQSRTRAQSTPQSVTSLGLGPPPEGYNANVGSGYFSEIFLLNITSDSPARSTAELQSKLRRFTGASGGY